MSPKSCLPNKPKKLHPETMDSSPEFDENAILQPRLFKQKSKHFLTQLRARICDFRLLPLTPRSVTSTNPKLQILVVICIDFEVIFYLSKAPRCF